MSAAVPASFLPAARRKPALVASIAVLLAVLAAALFAAALPYDAYRQDILHRNQPPWPSAS